MRRAGAVEIGQDKAMEAVSRNKAKVLLLPSDYTERAKRNAEFAVAGRKNPKLIYSNWTIEEISQALGVASCNMLAVTDRGFADAILKDLGGK